MADLRSGKPLASITRAQGKPVSGLESAMLAPVKARLEAAVKSGFMSKSEARHMLARLANGIDAFVAHGFRLRMHHDWHGVGAPGPAAFGL